MGYHDDEKEYVFFEGDTSAACDAQKSYQFDQGEYLTSFTMSTNGGVAGKWEDAGSYENEDLEKINGMQFTTSKGGEFKLVGKECTASAEAAHMRNNKWTEAQVGEANLCMSNVMEFDVDGRYLMGFMGSGKGSSFLTELGPIMSKKITSRQMSNLEV